MKILNFINDLKIKAFALLPNWFVNLPYSDKILHAILGTILYLLLCFVMAEDYAFASVFIIAFAIEVLSEFRKGGSGNFYDAIATFIIPLAIYIIKNIL
jgi:hypothetical protein